MKTPHLLASFAVAATAAATELKDPVEVAADWHKNTANPPIFSAEPGLGDPVVPLKSPRSLAPSPNRPAHRRGNPHVPYWGPIPRDKIYDAPNYRVPEVLPDNMPPGSKLWRYGGQDYYLIPLIPSREK